MREIAIIGGGPSGSMCGAQLARAGYSVTLYDERLAWEKPCGGGLTHKALVAYPFLLDGPYPKKLVHTVELISSSAHRALLPLDHPIAIYSRTVLNGLLLDRAAEAGCRLVKTRVTNIDTTGKRVRLKMGDQEIETDFAVIAAGARNALLPGTPRLERGDLEMTLGYFTPCESDTIRVKFLRSFEGYIWSFPRTDHLSVGICGSMAKHTSHELRGLLDQFMTDQGHSTKDARFYSHVLPSPQMPTLHDRPIAGDNWAMVGDAGALVDPITGEGLYYALRSGELLADALIAECPAAYPARVRADFSGDLEFATRIARYLYCGKFLGGSVTTRMIQFIDRSSAFRTLMADLFSGAQDYGSLKRRIWAQFGMTMSEVVASLFRPGTSLERVPAGDTNSPT
jgi:flavin-dependent dehydrogenase